MLFICRCLNLTSSYCNHITSLWIFTIQLLILCDSKVATISTEFGDFLKFFLQKMLRSVHLVGCSIRRHCKNMFSYVVSILLEVFLTNLESMFSHLDISRLAFSHLDISHLDFSHLVFHSHRFKISLVFH